VFGISGYTSHYNSYGHQQYHSQPPEQDLKKASKKKQRDNTKTLTSGDVKTLERHLSMKKTIRKKIMRDLQQAFVEDPNEFRTENTTVEQLKAEIRAEAVRFGDKNKRSDNFLDMLRGENYINSPQHREYDYDGPIAATNHSTASNNREEKQSFWKRLTMKSKNKR
jgi:SOS-response transcriptional repressor LexA